MSAYDQPVNKIATDLKTTLKTGLRESEARARLARHGPNELREKPPTSPFFLFIRQFHSPLIYILITAGLITVATAEFTDSIAIWAVLIFNAVIGFYQERKAEKTVQALKRYLTPEAKVIRSGNEQIIPAKDLVVGDIILLQAGDRVPADSRLITASNLQIIEAALTGEALPSTKHAEVLATDTPLADRENMAFMGTYVAQGSAEAIVVATGIHTEIGQIAKLIQTTAATETPLQRSIAQFGKGLSIAVIATTTSIFLLGLIVGRGILEMLGIAISLTVSAIPEGLPVVVTVTLAVGMWRMAQRQAVIRRLPAVETLGEVTVICTDKTGTLTQASMMVERVVTASAHYTVTGEDYLPRGSFYLGDRRVAKPSTDLKTIGAAAALASNAHLIVEGGNVREMIGDPTEAAVLTLGRKLGFDHPSDKNLTLPFDDKRRYSISEGSLDGEKATVYLGASEVLLAASTFYHDGHSIRLTQAKRHELEAEQEKLAEEGFRIVALAKSSDGADISKPAANLTFLAILAMQDPVRPQAAAAIRASLRAGIRVIMLTGDHLQTAGYVAQDVGLKVDSAIYSATELEKLSPEDFDKVAASAVVIARATPADKLKVVESLRRQGQIVAMTGDGVNDAPALKTADIGVAMGKIGTDVAVEAADMVLISDGFDRIVAAIEEGRVIWSNLRKVIFYLISTSVGELLTIIGALLLGMPLPVVAAQIIWLNLVTDGVSTIPLSLEKKEGDVLKYPPRKPAEPIVNRLMVGRTILVGLVMMIGTLLLFNLNLDRGLAVAQTSALLVLAAFQWFNVFNARSEHESIFQVGFTTNRYVVVSTVAAIGLQLGATYLPFMQVILKTVPLELTDWVIALTLGSSVLVIEEGRKYLFRTENLPSLASKTAAS